MKNEHSQLSPTGHFGGKAVWASDQVKYIRDDQGGSSRNPADNVESDDGDDVRDYDENEDTKSEDEQDLNQTEDELNVNEAGRQMTSDEESVASSVKSDDDDSDVEGDEDGPTWGKSSDDLPSFVSGKTAASTLGHHVHRPTPLVNSRENSSVDQAHDDSSEEGSSGSSSESEDDSGDENSQVSDVELSQDAGESGCDDKSVSSEDSACSDESIGLNLDSDDEDDEKEDDGKNSNVGIEVAPEKQVYEDGEQAGNENMGLVKRGSLCIEDLEDIINESPNESDARSDTAAVGMAFSDDEADEPATTAEEEESSVTIATLHGPKRMLSSQMLSALVQAKPGDKSKRLKFSLGGSRKPTVETTVLPDLPLFTLGESAQHSMRMTNVASSDVSSTDEDDELLGEELDECKNSDNEEDAAPVPLLTPPASPIVVHAEGGDTTACEWPSNLTVDSAMTSAIANSRSLSPDSLRKQDEEDEKRVMLSPICQKPTKLDPQTGLTPVLRGISVSFRVH